ncbi:helix-turn-helix domain-containing protein [Furfurilactobacillus milii]|uniref:Helix-turn-helix domain-containing protein n=1 Tax=Furfurilactobacillus milii TaxID=2888272 RepID=A0A6N9HZA9_9LACO|nr:helix-turn-helix domain-containing protein [Furfurilactobacillus milii]MYV16045.1 helix-turn-helix domain-containing protein [Furfurilactobacillus milii]
MNKREYIDLLPYIKEAQNGDTESLAFLLKRFDALLIKHAFINNQFDEDCYQDLRELFVYLVRKFNIDKHCDNADL